MPSIIDRIFKRKPVEEVNPFTGEVKIHHVDQETIQKFGAVTEKLVYEDRLARWSRAAIRTIAVIIAGFNVLMTLGYIQSLNIPFIFLFGFSAYFSLVYLKRYARVDPGRSL